MYVAGHTKNEKSEHKSHKYVFFVSIIFIIIFIFSFFFFFFAKNIIEKDEVLEDENDVGKFGNIVLAFCLTFFFVLFMFLDTFSYFSTECSNFSFAI